MNKKIRFAVIGCGHIGKRHSEKIQQDPRAELVAQCDLKAKASLGLDELYPNLPFFASLEDLLASDIAFDIACICVPNGLHFSLSSAVLKAGHSVLIEKPVVLRSEEGAILEQLAKERGLKIYSVLQNRYSQSSQWLKELMRKQALGKIYSIELNCLWNRDERYYTPDSWHGDKVLDGGTLYTQYSHFLDLLTWLFGELKIDGASFQNFNHQGLIDFEDSGRVLFHTEEEAQGQIFYSTAVYGRNLEVAMTILGEKGAVKVGGAFLNTIEHCEVEGVELPSDIEEVQGNQYGAYSGSAQNHHHVIANVVADMLGEQAEVCTLNEALKVVRLIENIYAFKK